MLKHRSPGQDSRKVKFLMSQHGANSTVSLISGIDGDLQVALDRTSLTTLIDVQSVHFDVSGHLRHDHSTIRLGFDAVCELRELLDEIDEPRDDRQPALPAIWSDSVSLQPVRPPVPARRRRRLAA
jgi:hypothetical protein